MLSADLPCAYASSRTNITARSIPQAFLPAAHCRFLDDRAPHQSLHVGLDGALPGVSPSPALQHPFPRPDSLHGSLLSHLWQFLLRLYSPDWMFATQGICAHQVGLAHPSLLGDDERVSLHRLLSAHRETALLGEDPARESPGTISTLAIPSLLAKRWAR